MRIAFVASLASPVREVTSRGEHVVIADLARCLRDRGHDVVVFCAQGSYLADLDTAPVMAGAGYDELFWHLERWEPDVISLHALDAHVQALACVVPTVHTLHANPAAPVPVVPTRPARATLVAVSEDSARRWREAGAANVHAIPHGVPAFATPATDPDPIALIAGRIAPEKGTATALAVARRAHLEPVVVGEVCDRAYFARDVAPLLDGAHVFRTLPRDRVAALMARAAVTLMPVEWDEPFGLVAAESQRVGCPVVAYARGALPEVVPQGVGGILAAPGDEDALVRAIRVARSMDRRKVREAARERLDLPLMIDRHEALLAEAATGMARDRAA